jgi:hypothetical protein
LEKCRGSTDLFYAEILAYIIKENIDSKNIVLLGHSMGCSLALDFGRYIYNNNKTLFEGGINIIGSAPFAAVLPDSENEKKLPDKNPNIHIFATATIEFPKIVLDCNYRDARKFIHAQSTINILASTVQGNSVDVRLMIREFVFRQDESDLYDFHLTDDFKKKFPFEFYNFKSGKCDYDHHWKNAYYVRLSTIIEDWEKKKIQSYTQRLRNIFFNP